MVSMQLAQNRDFTNDVLVLHAVGQHTKEGFDKLGK